VTTAQACTEGAPLAPRPLPSLATPPGPRSWGGTAAHHPVASRVCVALPMPPPRLQAALASQASACTTCTPLPNAMRALDHGYKRERDTHYLLHLRVCLGVAVPNAQRHHNLPWQAHRHSHSTSAKASYSSWEQGQGCKKMPCRSSRRRMRACMQSSCAQAKSKIGGKTACFMAEGARAQASQA
jgi:hypothetical protein